MTVKEEGWHINLRKRLEIFVISRKTLAAAFMPFLTACVMQLCDTERKYEEEPADSDVSDYRCECACVLRVCGCVD